IEPQVHFRDRANGRKAPRVRCIVAAQRANVAQRTRLQAEPVTAVPDRLVVDIIARLRYHRLIKPGWQQVDHVHEADKLLVLLRGHLAGDEDAEMPDALVQRIDDRLTVYSYFVLVIVKIEDPVQRLLRRRDVVASRTEHDDGTFNVAQVHPDAVGGAQLAA